MAYPGKTAYLDALKRAMVGLAPAVQAKTLAYYEQRFVDGVAAGRSEEAIAAELDDPTRIAMTLRASSHLAAFEQKRSPANFLRMAVAAVGLAIFNLLMVVPAAVYLSMLAALYGVAFGFYIIGIAVTASGLAGANELVLNRPFGIVLDDHQRAGRGQTHVSISERGIRVFNDKRSGADEAADAEADATDATAIAARAARAADAAGREAARAARDAERAGRATERAAARLQERANARANADSAAVAGAVADAVTDAVEETATQATADADIDTDQPRAAEVIKQAERAAARTIRITTDVDAASRTTQTAFGLAMVVGAILLFLLSLVISKYTLRGLKRYIQMNISLLKGN